MNIPTLYVMIGVSGSGKSTIAKRLGATVVSTDEIRGELFGNEADQRDPGKVFDIAYLRMNYNLWLMRDVVFDATNTTTRAREALIEAIREPCRIVAVLVNPPLDVAIERNSKRERIVPESVIRRQYEQLMRDGKTIPDQFDQIIVAD